MSIAYDAFARTIITTTGSWTHTPVGTPRGVAVLIQESAGVSDVISGVTYGGVAMTRVNRAVDSAGEVGSAYAYFLGTGIPTGAQTVTVTVSSGTTSKHCVSITVTAGADTQLAGTGSAIVQGDTANPSVTITSIAGASYGFGGLFSGQNATTGATAGTGQTMRDQADLGSQTCHAESSTSEQASGDLTIAFTAAIEDVAMVGFAIEELAAAAQIFHGKTYQQAVNRAATF